MAQLQNRMRRSIMCWGGVNQGISEVTAPKNKKDRSTKCWECGGAGNLRNNYPRVNQERSAPFNPPRGHFGIMKTIQKVRERFYWNNVRRDVEKWCHICDPCAVRKGPRKRTRGRLQLYNVGAPFERITFDILCPLPRLSDGKNNILVLMNCFNKWPEAYPISDQETVAEVLAQHWISRYGVPLQIHSDQGGNFDYEVSKRLCEILGIDKTRTKPRSSFFSLPTLDFQADCASSVFGLAIVRHSCFSSTYTNSQTITLNN
ncbi:retrovirus-related Pol polyprotein from transposon 412 [Trichonephila clavipes]|nr:retrovirus-related Pol polyprotein from transposon 412 [Trichonephila clavipes]